MFDLTQISAAVSGLGAVRELVKVGIDAKADAQAAQKVIDAMSRLGDAQEAMYQLRDELFRLQHENEALRRSAEDREHWDARFADYELVGTAGGAIVYQFKGEPAHFACPNCVNRRRIELLQDMRDMRGTYLCTAADCGARFPVKQRAANPVPLRSKNDSRFA